MKLFNTLLLIMLISHGTSFGEETSTLEAKQTADENVQEKSAALIKLNSYLADLESYEANFQQKISGASIGLSETTSGRFVMKRPNRFRWQINAPYEQTIIADGTSIWTIDVDLEQVTVNDIDDGLANSPIMLISRKNSQLERFFQVIELKTNPTLEQPPTEQSNAEQSETELPSSEQSNSDQASSEQSTLEQASTEQSKRVKPVVENFLLKPIDTSSNFEFIQLGFKDGVLQFIELNDSLGQVTTITMTNVRNNPIIADKEFIYEQQDDFDVIDSRSMSAESE